MINVKPSATRFRFSRPRRALLILAAAAMVAALLFYSKAIQGML